MEEEGEFAPLRLSVLGGTDGTVSPHPKQPESSTSTGEQTKWTVAHRLVTPHPLAPHNSGSSSIETVWQVCGTQQRVAVYPGPDGSRRNNAVVHASFQLPEEAAVAPPNASCLQWCVFGDSDDKEDTTTTTTTTSSGLVLACLVHPNAVTLYDVYGTTTTSSNKNSFQLPTEGWTVSLPFDCRSIHALERGLLLQRLETPEDDEHDDNKEFVLQEPPSLWNDNGSSIPPVAMNQQQQPNSSNGGVASLFTLHHPLDDILPVVLDAQQQAADAVFASHPNPVTDVLEQVLWVGTAEWRSRTQSTETKTTTTALLMVTYHTHRRRHAVWHLRAAPPPPAPVPLWEQTRQRYRVPHSNHAALSLDDLDGGVVGGGVMEPSSLSPSWKVSRDEALADALGVVVPTGRTAAATTAAGAPVSSNRRRTSSLFSPTASAKAATTGGGSHHHPMDVSHDNVTNAPAMNAAPPTLTTLQQHHQHPLYAKKAVACLYLEENQSEEQPAAQVFLATDAACTGTRVLVLHRAGGGELKLLSLATTEKGSKKDDVVVTLLDRLPGVVAAQPVRACPSPPLGGSAAVTDILVLRGGDQHQLTLYRAHTAVADVTADAASKENIRSSSKITDLEDAVHGCITVVVTTTSTTVDQLHKVRCRLNLAVDDCPVAERVLAAVDAALFVDGDDLVACQAALRMRIDCCRLVQALRQAAADRNKNDSSSSMVVVENPAWAALRELLLSVLLYETGATRGGSSVVAANKNNTESSSAWERLLRSEYHQMYAQLPSLTVVVDKDSPAGGGEGRTSSSHRTSSVVQDKLAQIGSLLLAHLHQSGSSNQLHRILDGIHLLYEDAKLSAASTTATTQLGTVASLLVELFQTVRTVQPDAASIVDPFLEYYRGDMDPREFEETSNLAASRQVQKQAPSSVAAAATVCRITSFATPPSIIAWIERRINGSNATSDVGVVEDFYDQMADSGGNAINGACSRTRSILRIYSVLTRANGGQQRDVDLVLTLLEEGFSDPTVIREDLPPGVSLPILEVLHRLRNNANLVKLPSTWSDDAWALIGRKDLSLNMSGNSSFIPESSGLVTVSSDEQNSSSSSSADGLLVAEDEAKDGLVPLERSSAMLFPEDNRVHEAARLLRSSRLIFLRVPRAVEVSDHDYERLKQRRLMLLARRSLALPTGRGMLTIGSLRPVPAEPLPLPEICLKGKVPPTNATLKLDVSDCPNDMQVWPDFHNGVAAGLRLPLDGERADLGSIVTRTWVIHNRPPVNNRPQARETGDDAPPPSPQSYSHGGVLYALGLRGHLTVLEMSDFYEYLTQGTVTTTVGVLLGLAANKRGSCDMSVSKMICLHIPSLIPQHFSAIDVASTVQAAAVSAAGLLYQSSSSRMMTEFLLNEIGRRPENDGNTSDREAYTLACGLALGTVNLAASSSNGDSDSRADGIADLHVEERLLRYIIGGVDQDELRRTRESNDRFSVPSAANGGESEKCSTIYEGNLINTDVTAPGATLALGLMYMKTENKSIASALALPDTHFLLDFVRPDFLGLRVIARALILWKDVQPTDEWIQGQIPVVVRNAYSHMRTIAKTAFGMHSPKGNAKQETDYDRRAVRQMYVHGVAGACFGIGLRFAGTGNTQAKAALMKRVSELHALRDGKDPVSAASRPEIPILESCLGTAAISLAMVLAGTGDLDALRLFKILRWRCEEESKYGIHMIYGMAIGLLFLGGGTCTIGREPEDIAALVTAFFPRFPMTSSDNQFHLQALRHLYSLAVKRKELRAIDVDTGENVYVPIQIKTYGVSEPQYFKVPCLLRNSDSPLNELKVLSDKYYPLTLDLSQRSNSYVFYVKKRSADIATNLHMPAFPRQLVGQKTGAGRRSTAETVKGLTDDPFLVAFAEFFIGGESSSNSTTVAASRNRSSGTTTTATGAEFTSRAFLECLTQDTEEALSLYLALAHGIRSLSETHPSSGNAAVLWDLRLIRTYYQQRQRLVGSGNGDTLAPRPLLNTHLLLPYLQELANRAIATGTSQPQEALRLLRALYSGI